MNIFQHLGGHRRHLSPTQLSMAAARVKEFYEKEAKERQKEGGRHKVPANLPEAKKGDSRDKAGKAMGVSGSPVDHAGESVERHFREYQRTKGPRRTQQRGNGEADFQGNRAKR